MQEERKKSEEDPDHHGHLDHSNPHTFEVQDLQMLMNKVRKDLEEVDESRRKEFKEYEMQKEFEKEQKMKEMDEEHKKQYLKELEEEKKAAQHHDPVRPVHHPGSQAQLEEVWEKSDHMSQKFDPKAFFYLHDLDGNGYWDEQEVNALFIKELDKIYAQQPNNHVDMREREEEMERMREHVFKETDTNRDRFISFTEFLEQTKRDEWRRDEGWESIDQKPQFTQKEYEEFEKQRQMEIQRLIEQGVLQPHPAGYQPQYQYVHPNQIHPNAVPQVPPCPRRWCSNKPGAVRHAPVPGTSGSSTTVPSSSCRSSTGSGPSPIPVSSSCWATAVPGAPSGPTTTVPGSSCTATIPASSRCWTTSLSGTSGRSTTIPSPPSCSATIPSSSCCSATVPSQPSSSVSAATGWTTTTTTAAAISTSPKPGTSSPTRIPNQPNPACSQPGSAQRSTGSSPRSAGSSSRSAGSSPRSAGSSPE
uniref:Nucleobindin-1 n=1 Tax=Lygus hesperus TaxID=30085 RepID=A0A0A9YK70_LYGHE